MTLKLFAFGLLLVSLVQPSRVERERDDAIAHVQSLETALGEIRDQVRAQQARHGTGVPTEREFLAGLDAFVTATLEDAKR